MNSKPKKPTTLESHVPWKRKLNVTDESIFSDNGKRMSRGSIDGGDLMRVTTPTATEMMLPWKRDEEDGCGPLQQAEFPSWASNKEYLAYNSPSATFLGGLENPNKNTIFGLFRRESLGSDPTNSNESTPLKDRRGSASRASVVLVEENESDPLGAIQKEVPLQKQHSLGATPQIPPPPQTPGQRRQARRGSMLELSGSLTRDSIPEEYNNQLHPQQTSSLKRPQWLLQHQNSRTRRSSLSRQHTLGTALMGTLSSPSTDSSSDEDADLLMKRGF